MKLSPIKERLEILGAAAVSAALAVVAMMFAVTSGASPTGLVLQLAGRAIRPFQNW